MAKVKKINKNRDWVDILCYGILGVIIIALVLALEKNPSSFSLSNILHLMV